MKIKFILPYSGDPRGLLTNYGFTTRTFFAHPKKKVSDRMPFMSLAFPILASLCPPDTEMEILDEAVDEIDFDDKVDIVALTGMTYMAPHAYRLADEFRKRGVYVVMGGVHVSLAVEEALQHVDCVFVGEADNTWVQFLEDFRKKKPQRVYRDSGIVDLAQARLPRWDLVRNKYYMPYFVQASRGCCFNCDFCQIHLTFGKKIRYKPTELVVEEIRQLYKHYTMEFWGGNPMVFADDNIIASIPEAEKLFRALVPLKIMWCSLSSVNVARHDKLMDLMVESGCDHLFIGFESISQESMDLVNKGHVNQVSQYKGYLEALHRKGINVSSLMMYGLDGDDVSIFQKTVDFVRETDLEFPLFHTLLPLPGTVLTKRQEEQGQVLTYDWTKYTGYYACIRPKKMTPEALEQGNDWSTKEVYSEDAILDKIDHLYEKGALRGKKIFFWNRLLMSLWLLVVMFAHPRGVARFIRKIVWTLWAKPYSKISMLLLFIDHFEFSSKIPAVECPTESAERSSAPASETMPASTPSAA